MAFNSTVVFFFVYKFYAMVILRVCTIYFFQSPLLCDKQVIASALVQLRINFTCIFKVFQILSKL